MLFRKKCLVAHGKWADGLKELDWADSKLPFKIIVDSVLDNSYDRLKVSSTLMASSTKERCFTTRLFSDM